MKTTAMQPNVSMDDVANAIVGTIVFAPIAIVSGILAVIFSVCATAVMAALPFLAFIVLLKLAF